MIVIDTHVWLWWTTKQLQQFSPAAQNALTTADRIAVPSLCCYELAMLERRKRISMDREVRAWFAQASTGQRIEVLPLTGEIAVAASLLLWDHSDPLDRMIVATAIVHRAPLVTKDDRIRRFQGVATIW